MSGFTPKRDERQERVCTRLSEASAGSKAVRGFTLIEALVAVSILTLSVVGPLFTASRAIVAAQIARDQLTASYLAQEGIEYVRAMRDNEYLAAHSAGGSTVSSDAWTSFLTGGNSASITSCRTMTCTLDPSRSMGTGVGLSLMPCANSSCTPLHLTQLANGAYGYTQEGDTATSFTRTIQVLDIPGTEGAPLYPDKRLVSTVSWTFHGTPYSVTITDHLTPWQ